MQLLVDLLRLKKHFFYTALCLLSLCWLGLQLVSVQTAWQLLAHKTLVREKPITAESTTLYFSLHEWQAISKPEVHELEYNGQRFDIQRLSIKGNTVCVKGIFDTWETNWLTRHRSLPTHHIQPMWVAFFYFEQPLRIQIPTFQLIEEQSFVDAYAMPLLKGLGHDVVKPPAC
jgi:hypothetical protein